jgi:predicted phosphoadenosine phosphosulfate sulfurtransferase
MGKVGLGIDVLTAAQQRISRVFDDFPRIYVSCSWGKDSTVMLHLVMAEAIARGRRVGVLFLDLEGQYKLTIEHGLEIIDLYKDHIDVYWVSLPIHLRNAVSQFEPHWISWAPGREEDWIREPPEMAITDQNFFPFYSFGMEFEEFVPAFGHWYAQGKLCACFVGIRSDESLNRYRSIARRDKRTFEGLQWTTWLGSYLYNAYPIYDWRTEDVWRFHGLTRLPYNRLYDRMHQAGLTIHQARICQPYGDDQRKGLHLFHVIEPETWGRVLARVNGANQGALYSQERGNILGVHKISLPEGHTWESFAHLILDTMPPQTAEHYRNKIAVFLRWWTQRGYATGIPDFGDPKDEASKKVPSWRRICKSLLRNDYWCKGLSFTQTSSQQDAFRKYRKLMRKRRREWGLI